MIRRRQPSLIRTHRPGPRPEPLEARVLFAAGDVDPTFGGHDGVVVQDVIPYVNADFSRNDYKHGLGAESLYDVAELPDGRLLAVGGGDGAFIITRYNPDGSPDTTFGGGDGIVQTVLDANTLKSTARAVAVLGDGKFLVAGTADRERFALAKYNADGSLDTTFAAGGADGDGVASLVDKAAERAGARSISLGPDGKIVLAGSASHTEYFGRGGSWTTWFFSVARLDPNGTADTSFGGGDGVAISPSHGSVGAVAPLPGGKFLVAVEGGAPETGGTDGLAKTIRRFNADGSADASFGPGGDDGDGAVTSGLYGSQAVHVVNALHALPDGRALAVGAANTMEELEQNRGPADPRRGRRRRGFHASRLRRRRRRPGPGAGREVRRHRRRAEPHDLDPAVRPRRHPRPNLRHSRRGGRATGGRGRRGRDRR